MNNALPGVTGRILIVDDDTDFLELAEKMLAGHYEVSLAKSGKQALEYLGRGSLPDLIFLDVDMPGMNGYETLKKIKALDGMEAMPVVFLTGMAETAAELRGLELGAVDYITKPFVKDILLKRLEIHLRQGKELRAVYGERRKKKKPESMTPLTPWEKKIALLAQKRLTSGEIAENLKTTEGTIRTALNTIYIKLDIHSKRKLADFDLEKD
ncbi:MAG: response regulator [Treponema sp.]|jgi:DNA-binding response OmpR family regulator|nr:response regulator [Treponema sp.]